MSDFPLINLGGNQYFPAVFYNFPPFLEGGRGSNLIFQKFSTVFLQFSLFSAEALPRPSDRVTNLVEALLRLSTKLVAWSNGLNKASAKLIMIGFVGIIDLSEGQKF